MKNLLTAATLLVALNAWSQQLPTNEESSGFKPSGQKLQLVHSGGGPHRPGSEPLYVVDGVPSLKTDSVRGTARQVKVVPDLYANDVQTIEVLKDASATARYGEDGANGVILITTKHRISSKKRG